MLSALSQGLNDVIAHLLAKDPELLFVEDSTPFILRFSFGRHSSSTGVVDYVSDVLVKVWECYQSFIGSRWHSGCGRDHSRRSRVMRPLIIHWVSGHASDT